jgi:hypothetical protein
MWYAIESLKWCYADGLMKCSIVPVLHPWQVLLPFFLGVNRKDTRGIVRGIYSQPWFDRLNADGT